MAVPGFQEFMYPFLEILSDENEHSLQEIYTILATRYNLNEEDLTELIPSGKETKFKNRISWVRTYLKKAGLIDAVGRGVFKINTLGLNVINNQNVTEINTRFLNQFETFNRFQNSQIIEGQSLNSEENEGEDETPLELVENNYKLIINKLKEELLDKTLACSPRFFENLIIELLISMGYGGSIEEAGKAIGRSGGGGIDGIIKEDYLGLDMIYLQAKRWNTNQAVTVSEIRGFAGSLDGVRAKKGVFITTSRFTREARDFVSQVEKRIILIDGNELTDLMIKFNVGVSLEHTYAIKKVDEDFFETE